MIRIETRAKSSPEVAGTLRLTFHARSKTRQLCQLVTGEEVALFLPRGSVLREGDFLQDREGRVYQVEAALETVSTAFAEGLPLARLAYHLGNRHVALQIGDGWVRYLHDHVLDEMVTAHGHAVTVSSSKFEPEEGAYGHRGHSHEHS